MRIDVAGNERPCLTVDMSGDWPRFAARRIRLEAEKHYAAKGICTLMLTGGVTAARLYDRWSRDPFWGSGAIEYYFGDERCVPVEAIESNYGLFMRTAFPGGRPPGCRVHRMEADDSDLKAAAARYESLLPGSVDVLLLGLGTDGHIASLFPNDAAVHGVGGRVDTAEAPTSPRGRLTITPSVIERAKSVFVIATGTEKGRVLRKALEFPGNTASMPVRLAMRGTWLVDRDAAAAVQQALSRVGQRH